MTGGRWKGGNKSKAVRFSSKLPDSTRARFGVSNKPARAHEEHKHGEQSAEEGQVWSTRLKDCHQKAWGV